jgi:hypothetical protein
MLTIAISSQKDPLRLAQAKLWQQRCQLVGLRPVLYYTDLDSLEDICREFPRIVKECLEKYKEPILFSGTDNYFVSYPTEHDFKKLPAGIDTAIVPHMLKINPDLLTMANSVKTGVYCSTTISFKYTEKVLLGLDDLIYLHSSPTTYGNSLRLFYDQTWLEWYPALFNTYVIRHPGYNQAFYNLHENRPLEDLVYWHFTGWDGRELYSRHHKEPVAAQHKQLYQEYAEALYESN